MTILIAMSMIVAETRCPKSSTPEVAECVTAEFKRADDELNLYYSAAIHRLKNDSESAAALRGLRQSENSWIVFRGEECGAVDKFWSPGSIHAIFMAKCMTQLTKSRTMSLWSNWLTYVDSTPPILPKPFTPYSATCD